jgi:hypothetical protein
MRREMFILTSVFLIQYSVFVPPWSTPAGSANGEVYGWLPADGNVSLSDP